MEKQAMHKQSHSYCVRVFEANSKFSFVFGKDLLSGTELNEQHNVNGLCVFFLLHIRICCKEFSTSHRTKSQE